MTVVTRSSGCPESVSVQPSPATSPFPVTVGRQRGDAVTLECVAGTTLFREGPVSAESHVERAVALGAAQIPHSLGLAQRERGLRGHGYDAARGEVDWNLIDRHRDGQFGRSIHGLTVAHPRDEATRRHLNRACRAAVFGLRLGHHGCHQHGTTEVVLVRHGPEVVFIRMNETHRNPERGAVVDGLHGQASNVRVELHMELCVALPVCSALLIVVEVPVVVHLDAVMGSHDGGERPQHGPSEEEFLRPGGVTDELVAGDVVSVEGDTRRGQAEADRDDGRKSVVVVEAGSLVTRPDDGRGTRSRAVS